MRDVIFETYIAPHIERMANLAHQHGKKLIFHSPGRLVLQDEVPVEAVVALYEVGYRYSS